MLHDRELEMSGQNPIDKTVPNTACTGRLGVGAFFEACSEFWKVSVSELYSPQPPVTQAVGRLDAINVLSIKIK